MNMSQVMYVPIAALQNETNVKIFRIIASSTYFVLAIFVQKQKNQNDLPTSWESRNNLQTNVWFRFSFAGLFWKSNYSVTLTS